MKKPEQKGLFETFKTDQRLQNEHIRTITEVAKYKNHLYECTQDIIGALLTNDEPYLQRTFYDYVEVMENICILYTSGFASGDVFEAFYYEFEDLIDDDNSWFVKLLHRFKWSLSDCILTALDKFTTCAPDQPLSTDEVKENELS